MQAALTVANLDLANRAEVFLSEYHRGTLLTSPSGTQATHQTIRTSFVEKPGLLQYFPGAGLPEYSERYVGDAFEADAVRCRRRTACGSADLL